MASIFTTQTPGNMGALENQVTVGTVFTCSASDQTAIGARYYKGQDDGNTIAQPVYLYDASNAVIASGSRVQTAGDPLGWITVNFTTPVALTANATYTVAHNTGAASKSYVSTASGLSSAISNPPLTAQASGGRWLYTATNAYPTNAVATNYFVDIVTQGPNVAPTANAGADQSVAAGATVTLTGTDSDSDGTIATRTWSQTSGTPTVTLSGTGATRTFTAPSQAGGATLVFTYQVTDNAGATTTDTMTVVVAAPAANVAPTVNAGPDQSSIEPWATVTLTATAADPNGTTPTVSWAQTAGAPTVTLAGSGATRTFTAPGTLAGTTLTFTATASDGTLSATDTMTVAVLPVTERAVVGGVEVPMQIRVN